MKKKKVTIFLSILVLALFVTSISVFAYWQILKINDQNANGNINIGEGDEVTTVINVADAADSKKLIPANFTPKEDETTKATLTFNVTWTSDSADSAIGNLVVNYSLSALDEVYGKLLDITISYPNSSSLISLDGSALVVTVEIELLEPDNKTEYDIIANSSIEIPFTFKILT